MLDYTPTTIQMVEKEFNIKRNVLPRVALDNVLGGQCS